MKHQGLLHPELSGIVAGIGHTQTIVIGDVGLPVPDGVRRIDLAVSAGVPSLLDVLRAVLSELIVEGVTVAEETRLYSPDWSAQLEPLLPAPRREVPHTRFKELVQDAYVVVRTGEVTSYANVILHCGVNFWEDPYKASSEEMAGQQGKAP
ncbi:D-ribose pyranase [Deinococcus aquiradiocola]|uniref:D-ribose pyranase n=1 Tax=Deinococcus aquiradiocola TaxID=393059 RepID=A0A917ULQ3_9DEIO|nr:D-ribose pyranase [Deinococcus aquiradiocola]GGJ66762.1 D-ribose pyranase [Deinococcus aquiradiocola]